MTLQLVSDKKYLAKDPSHDNILEATTRYMIPASDKFYKESAFVMITCEDYRDVSVAQGLQSIKEVKEIQHTYGNYDIIIKIETDSVDSMCHIIETKIRKMSGIRATTTLISSPILVF